MTTKPETTKYPQWGIRPDAETLEMAKALIALYESRGFKLTLGGLVRKALAALAEKEGINNER